MIDEESGCAPGGEAGDRQMCAQVAGWAVKTLDADPDNAKCKPLLRALKVSLPDGTDGLWILDPAVAYVL